MKLSDFKVEEKKIEKKVFYGGSVIESDRQFLKEHRIRLMDLVSQSVKELKGEDIILDDNQIINEFKEWRKTKSQFFNASSIRLEEIALWTKYILEKR